MEENNQLNELEDVITVEMVDEDGKSVEFYVDDQFYFNGAEYWVLCESDDADDAVLMRAEVKEDGSTDCYLVEDEKEFNEVSAYYMTLFEGEEED